MAVNQGKMRFYHIVISAGLALIASLQVARADPQLIMVDQRGCAYCALWDRQIAPAYPNTAEGRFAPLWRLDIGDLPPEGVTLARRVSFTPTFILIDDGAELARMEGYPGQDFFWPLLAQLLEKNTAFDAATN